MFSPKKQVPHPIPYKIFKKTWTTPENCAIIRSRAFGHINVKEDLVCQKSRIISRHRFTIRREIPISGTAIQQLPAILSHGTDECRAMM